MWLCSGRGYCLGGEGAGVRVSGRKEECPLWTGAEGEGKGCRLPSAPLSPALQPLSLLSLPPLPSSSPPPHHRHRFSRASAEMEPTWRGPSPSSAASISSPRSPPLRLRCVATLLLLASNTSFHLLLSSFISSSSASPQGNFSQNVPLAESKGNFVDAKEENSPHAPWLISDVEGIGRDERASLAGG